MSVLPVGFGSALGGYQIERSLRFNSADSAYLNRTPGSASNRKTWTWSGWVKKTGTSISTFISADPNSGNRATSFYTRSITDGRLEFEYFDGTTTYNLTCAALLRDPSAYYHLILAVDTTQATNTNRTKIYVNGVQQTLSGTYVPQNTDMDINNTVRHNLGRFQNANAGAGSYLDGYLTEVNFIDGQALTPSSFGETDTNTGVWKPKAYSGTYGTNGFYLKFADNSGTTSTTLGKDSSGNGNNWTPNNFSVTAGAGNDSMVDSPTAYGTDTGVGGEVRGNYCTMSPILGGGTTNVNGNLDVTCPDNKSTGGTFGMSSGKWYFEATVASADYVSVGVARNDEVWGTNLNGSSEAFMYSYVGTVYTKGSADTTPVSFTTNDIISVCVDLDANKLYFLKNGSGITISAGTQNPSTGTNGISLDAGYTYFSAITANGNNAVAYFNFGQRAFAYTAPSGFKALCTTNLPTPTIGATSTTQANDYFNAVTYTGNGTSLSVTGVGFQPDLIWIKDRSNARAHVLQNAIAGFSQYLQSNATDAETTASSGVTAVGSDGFTVGTQLAWNSNTETYVAWNWNAGGSNATNTSGTITSTVRANTTSGFSIVTYTGNGTNGATIGHGLGVAPQMIIVKGRSTTDGWPVYHTSILNTQSLRLNTTAAVVTAGFWNNTTAGSSVFTVGGGVFSETNTTSATYVAYCFAPVAGYSAFGSYTGNGSGGAAGTGDGPFVYTGFRPRWIMVKVISGTTANWSIIDTARSPYNFANLELWPSSSAVEQTYAIADILSNGFKLRSDSGQWNTNGAVYIYAAFAESPFKYSLAR